MKKILNLVLIFPLFLIIFSCSGVGEKKDTSELYKKSTTREAIIERSGTLMRAGNSEEAQRTQFMDAENRLATGGGLFGKKAGLDLSFGEKKGGEVASVGMPINPYLWKGSLETINFMPLVSADPFGGVIITDWYTDKNESNQRCKLNIFIKGVELKTSNLKVNSFCQTLNSNNMWVDQKVDNENNLKLENAILNKAKKIKLSQS